MQLPPIARGLWTKSGGQHGDAAGGENDDFIEGQSIPVCFYPRCSQLHPVVAAVIGLPMPRNTLAHLIPGTLHVVVLILGISLSQNTDFSFNRLTLLTRHVNW